jgi:hypothetical protein
MSCFVVVNFGEVQNPVHYPHLFQRDLDAILLQFSTKMTCHCERSEAICQVSAGFLFKI